MPELPEIETIKLDLERVLLNKKIKSVTVNLAKQVKSQLKKFHQTVSGSIIKKIYRRAKTVIFELNNKHYLVFHLKMSGQLIYRQKNNKFLGGGHPISHNLKDLPNKYSHIIFDFADKSKLFFNDQRQFGWVKLFNSQEFADYDNSFGPEPLDKDFTYLKFKQIIKPKKKAIKPLLMEPKIVAGIGNIYAAESCFCAGILPTRSAHTLSETELKKLYQCIKKVLKLAIKKRGTSADKYVDAFGRQGSMNKSLKVYARAGEKCPRCNHKIHQLRQSSRSTFYCPKCQK